MLKKEFYPFLQLQCPLSLSLNADYYGTVVNTAARVEAVCHGGQVCVTQEFCEQLGGDPPETVWTDLGSHTGRVWLVAVHKLNVK